MRQRDVFWFWLPLFASWLLMTAEGPVVSAAINRLPNEVIMLAAQGIIVSLAVTIESPIINLLATSTALVKDRASYLLMRRFTMHWLILLTAVSVLIAFTPLFDVVVIDWLGTPAAVSEWVRPGMRIMTLWSAAIGWRRFLQGILIHFNQPRKMVWGTVIRLLASGGGVIALARWTNLPGVISGTTALMAGVIAEAIYATFAVRPLLQHELGPGAPADGDEPLTYADLFWFHLPLAGTAVMVLLVQPLVNLVLARLDQPTESLAAWPVLFQIMLMARAAALALPEAVIALTRSPETWLPVRRFVRNMSLGLTVVLALFVLTPAADYYLVVVQDMTAVVSEMARANLPLFILFPGLTAVAMWLRGLLIHARQTKDVNLGMLVNLLVTAVILTIGLYWRWPSLRLAALSLNLAMVAEIIFLAWRTQRIAPVSLFGSLGSQKLKQTSEVYS